MWGFYVASLKIAQIFQIKTPPCDSVFFSPWNFFFLPWKFLEFRPWKCEPSRENVLKTARENLKVPVKFFAKCLPWKQKMVGVKKMKISTREKHKSAREKKS